MVRIRRAEPNDLPAIRRLFEEREGGALGELPVRTRAFDFDPARGALLVADADGEVVAMSGVELRTLRDGSRRRRAGYWTDLYVAERARGRLLYVPLARATLDAAREEGCELVYTANRRPEVYEAHVKLGFRIVGVFDVLARPLSPLGFALREAHAPRGVRASVARPVDALLGRAFDRVRGRLARGPADDVDTIAVADDAEEACCARFLALPERAGSIARAFEPRQLRARLRTPLDGRSHHALFVREGARDAAGALVRIARRGRFEAVVLLDLRARTPDAADVALRAVEQFGREHGADLALALDGAPEARAWLAEAGYLRTPERYLLLAHPPDVVVDPRFGVASQHRFPFLEHDAF